MDDCGLEREFKYNVKNIIMYKDLRELTTSIKAIELLKDLMHNNDYYYIYDK